jgi:hypothetical protein
MTAAVALLMFIGLLVALTGKDTRRDQADRDRVSRLFGDPQWRADQ